MMTQDQKIKLYELARSTTREVNAIYLHWTAGRYDQVFADYHICIGEYGDIHLMTGPGQSLFDEVKEHTWHRNSESIGIALCCAYGAQANHGYDIDFGLYPPTSAQIEVTAQLAALLCDGFETCPINNVMTHCEAALCDDYGPGSMDPETRWDLWFIPDGGKLVPGGLTIRKKIRQYRAAAMIKSL